MTITAQRILTELGNRAWSGFNADELADFTSTEAIQAKTELNFALRYLINLVDFPFKLKEKELLVKPRLYEYNMVEGQINSIYNSETLDQLTYLDSGDSYDKKQEGEPTGYWINYKNPNQKIRLYPIPDNNYKFKVVYNQYKPVITTDNSFAFEFENANDILNMPSNLEYLFLDCLVLRVMITNNKDDQDENYNPTISEFNEAWKVFKRACKPTVQEVRAIF